MHAHSIILPALAASILHPSTSEAAFAPSTSDRAMHRGKGGITPDKTYKYTNTPLHVSLDDINMSSASSLLSSGIGISSSFLGSNTDFQGSAVSQLLALNENMSGALCDSNTQSIIMHTLAHVADFSTLLVPEVSLLRTAALLGRICSISADYIPDHSIAADEAIFQGPMLIVSAALFAQSAFPMIATGLSSLVPIKDKMVDDESSSSSSSKWKNRYAFHHLFRQLGVSLLQFRYMTSMGAIDWIDVKPNETLIDDQDETEYLYWVYRGSTELSFGNDESVTFVDCYNDEKFVGLLPDMKFLCQLDKKKMKHKKGTVASSSLNMPSSCQYPQATIKAGGPNGARVMRLHKKKLQQLMETDNKLSDSIHALMVNGMQRELEVLLTTTHMDVDTARKSVSLARVGA